MPITSKSDEPTRDLRDASPLCLECGLCCNGAIHHYGVLKEGEVASASRLGMIVERTPDYLGFAQPCSKFDGKQCTIYEQRPSACSGYYCGLARRYRRNEISFEEALPLVREAQRLLAAAIASVPLAWSFRDLRRKLRSRIRGQAGGELSAEEQRNLGEPLMKIALLDVFLDRNLRLERELTFKSLAMDALAKKPAETDRPSPRDGGRDGRHGDLHHGR
jgi:Fe-S-cluster containining protein